MNVVERARATYGKNAVPIMSGRAAEHETMARVSHRLRAAALNSRKDFAPYASALHDNLKLWTTLATDVAHPDNALPDDLRGRIFWLAEFVSAETRKLLKGDGDVAVLIEINAAVLKGLRGQEAGA